MRKGLLCFLLALTVAFCRPLPARAATLAWGSSGDQVRQVQEKLIRYGYMTGTADGIFGRATYDAVICFQQKNGLAVDGRVGSATAAALGLTLDAPALSAGSFRDTELNLLARLVNGEARGEPYVGQVAVAAVVLNRVRSASFPNTVSGVIFQTGAFDAVWDGQFDLEPDESCVRAARDALNGWDPTGGCVYYYNPATATNAWIRTRSVQLSIGNHAFAV